jgi:sorbitol-specific phosphotransferase system component IIC
MFVGQTQLENLLQDCKRNNLAMYLALPLPSQVIFNLSNIAKFDLTLQTINTSKLNLPSI